jgi:hypothetical protein
MGPMRYLLNAREAAFKTAVRELAARAGRSGDAGSGEGSGPSVRLTADLRRWLDDHRPDGLSRVEELVALEELGRKRLDGTRTLAECGALRTSGQGLRAAAALGDAQGALASCLGKPSGPAFQTVCDIASELEAARLLLYRAAVLEDEGRGDPEAVNMAAREAEGLALRARAVRENAEKGGPHEARIPVPVGDRSGDR